MRSTKDRMQTAASILAELNNVYGEPKCALDYTTPFELLVAVVLSAQCTDKRVNVVTKQLFAVANTPQAMLQLGEERLAQYIYSCGFYHSKASNIIKASRALIDHYDGVVPSTVEQLMGLAGVGRKTANVVYAVAFNGQAIAVDTHVSRLAKRFGLTDSDNPLKIEQHLLEVVPEQSRTLFHHLLIAHGRAVCKAVKPKCEECTVRRLCPFGSANSKL